LSVQNSEGRSGQQNWKSTFSGLMVLRSVWKKDLFLFHIIVVGSDKMPMKNL